jgi:hypothetical protein
MMAIVMEEKELKDNSGLGEDLSPYNLFSVFLEWQVLDSIHPDLTCIPEEYINYIIESIKIHPESGDMIHLMMLFSEHAQLKKTGTRKVQLSTEKYQKMCQEFAVFCQLELERRKSVIQDVMTSDIFNPNMKTTFFIDGLENVPEHLIASLNSLQVGIQESPQS